ncbi:MAG: NTP transferase domain-containing protein [Coriobacteriales bacterium]|jgi:UTP--glucose-1-phosphate uridylyltransferase|nr:NTP transferase domain-containing protein [Coriobacteriales bacterium]
MKAIIPAAGLGTRFLPATKAQPKGMLPILAKPAIQYVAEEALAAGVDEVLIVSNAQKRCIEAHFSSDESLVALLEAAGKSTYADEVRRAGALPVSFVEQLRPLGLGHAICCAADAVLGSGMSGGGFANGAAERVAVSGESFLVLLGDVLVPDNGLLPRMLEVSREHNGASVIAVFPVPREQVSRFGIIAGEALSSTVWRVTGMVEKPSRESAPSNLAIFGRYLLTPLVMELLAHTTPGAGGEIQLTDALIELLKYEKVYALIVDPDEGFDVGTVESWLATNLRLAQRDPVLAAALRALI